MGAKGTLIIFGGGVYVTENTFRGASVELATKGGQPRRRAQRRSPSAALRPGNSLPEKTVRVFLGSLKRGPHGPRFSFCVYVDEFGFELGVDYFLAAVEAGVAGEHVGYGYGDGEVHRAVRAEEFDGKRY